MGRQVLVNDGHNHVGGGGNEREKPFRKTTEIWVNPGVIKLESEGSAGRWSRERKSGLIGK